MKSRPIGPREAHELQNQLTAQQAVVVPEAQLRPLLEAYMVSTAERMRAIDAKLDSGLVVVETQIEID